MAGRMRNEIPARLPTQVTVASRCNQYVSASAQVGGVVIMEQEYWELESLLVEQAEPAYLLEAPQAGYRWERALVLQGWA